MPSYTIYGKWFHLDFSDYFKEVVRVDSPTAALMQFAEAVAQSALSDDVDWHTRPSHEVQLGWQSPEPAFMVGSDQLYRVRKIELAPALSKDKIIQAIQEMPEDTTIEDAIERLYLLHQIERAEAQIAAGEGISHEEVKQRLAKWRE